MVVRHIAVEEVVVVPSYDTRVRPNPQETAVDVLGGNRVEGTPDVEKGCQAVGPGVYVAFDVVDQARRSSLSLSLIHI